MVIHTRSTPLAGLRLAMGLLLLVVLTALAYTLFGDEAGVGMLMANTFATPSWVMRKVARRLTNNAVFAGNVMRDYDPEYRQKGCKVGSTITLRLPQRFEPTIGAIMNATPLNDQTVTLTITDQTNIGFEYDTWAATLEVDDYMERYGNGAVDTLVNNIDYTGLSRMYKKVAKVVGTPGTVPTANATYTLAKTKLVEAAVPRPYKAILTADMHGQLANANTALFNPSAQVSAFFRKGQFSGPALGIDEWHEDENAATHTVGNLGGTPLSNSAGQTGASITADGVTASISKYLYEGDVVQWASVYDINPLSHASTGRLKDFTVTADVDSTAGSVITVPISPGIVTSGPFANASAAVANNDAMTIFGHASSYADAVSRQGLVYHKEAFALVMADLVLPRGLWISERISNAKLGISVRMLKDHQIVDDVSPARLDTAHGWGAIRQELCCRVCS